MLVGLFVLVGMEAITGKITLKRKKRKKYARKPSAVEPKVVDAPRPISREEALKQIAEIDKLLAEAKGQDPFWYFEPSDGSITEDGKALLQKYLKPDDIPQRLDSQKDLFASKASIKGASGGNQCLGGETEIYDPYLKLKMAVKDIKGSFHVYAWDGKGLVVAQAETPFVKQEDDLYKFELSNGEDFVASMSHLVLTQEGYVSLADVHRGCVPILQASTSGISLLAHGADANYFCQKVQDSQSDCLAYPHSYDERPQEDLNISQDAFPLQADVLEHKEQVFLHKDDHTNISGHTRPCLWNGHLSNQDDRHLHEGHGAGSLFRSSCKPSAPVLYPPPTEPQSLGVSNHQPQSIGATAQQAKHNDTQSSPLETSSLVYDLTVTNVTWLRKDVKYDFTVPVYHNYYLAGGIHHNSGKSTFGSVYGYIWATGEVPEGLKGIFPEEILTPDRNRNIRVVGVSNKQLMNTVLPTYQKWVPRKYLAKGKWSESFSSEQKKLFLSVDGVGEPIATIEFMTNEQDTESFQGPPLGLVIYDEEPSEKVRKENLMRFVTSGQLNEVFCWTPTNGLSWATDLFSDETDDRGRSIDLCKFASVTNKKANMQVVDEICSEIHDYNELKMRLLGEFVSLSGLVYGNLFDANIHVIEPFKITVKDYIVYRGLDPHLVKPSVCVEVAVDREENYYVIGTYSKDCDTSDLKKDLKERAKNYRLGQTRCDRSADSTIKVLGDRNIFKELGTGENAIPALFKSEKFTGSIHAGVDTIKQLLKVNEKVKKPKLFIFNVPENKLLITAFKTLERDAYVNEDVKGKRDKIMEGKHDAHAALRYVFQSRVPWIAPTEAVPEYEPVSENVGY